MLYAALFLVAASAATPSPSPAPYAYAHHAIATADPVSQALFDRGLTLYYAYNGSEGVHVFRSLEGREPNLAIAYWGEALSDGPDINTPLDRAHFDAGHTAIEKAVALEAGASDSERAYIDAMRLRFAGRWKNQGRAEAAYRSAMAGAVAKFPQDDDLAALYVEALLENQVFNNHYVLWKPGTTIPANNDTAVMANVLETILARNPMHIMANHLVVHVYEPASDHTKPMVSAARLDAMNFAPEDEHLAHMPAHTHIDVGDYAQAVATSLRAIALFDAYLATPGIDPIHARYLRHDVSVGYSAAMMLGNYAQAAWFAQRLTKLPHGEAAVALTDARFGHWDDLANVKPTGAADQNRFAIAYWKLHVGDAAAAEAELSDGLDNKSSSTSYLLYALRGAAQMMQHHATDAEADFKKAAAMESTAYRGEYIPGFPTGEIVGGAYFRAGDYASAEAAYRGTLGRYPNDARALYGLWQTLNREGKSALAQTVAAQFNAVWQGSDTTLTPADL